MVIKTRPSPASLSLSLQAIFRLLFVFSNSTIVQQIYVKNYPSSFGIRTLELLLFNLAS